VGNYDVNGPSYQREVVAAAGPEVVFSGPIYDAPVLSALRFYCRLHIHGHQVGGTNPSLLEAMASGNPVLAHDNPYNRWVAGDGAVYFLDEQALDTQLGALLADESVRKRLSMAGRHRHAEMFTWKVVLSQYEELLDKWHPRSADGSYEIPQPPPR
jgi:glycosyltransferase involved in cell wall biosynthesis